MDLASFSCGEIEDDLILFRKKHSLEANEDKGSEVSQDMKRTREKKMHEEGIQDLFSTPGCPERRLLLIVVGHNPSSYSWGQGHYYANPSNYMWKLLAGSNLVPSHFTAQNDQRCPNECGVGFADLVVGVNETVSSNLKMEKLRSCKRSFYERLLAHCERVSRISNMGAVECSPNVIAFAGKRQWKALFPTSTTISFSYGIQKHLPPDWPHILSKSVVFLLPSSSGAAAMSQQERYAPYRELGLLVGKFRNDSETPRSDST